LINDGGAQQIRPEPTLAAPGSGAIDSHDNFASGPPSPLSGAPDGQENQKDGLSPMMFT